MSKNWKNWMILMFHYQDFLHDAAAIAAQNGFRTHLLEGLLPQLQHHEHSHWIQCNPFVAAKNCSHSRTVWTGLKGYEKHRSDSIVTSLDQKLKILGAYNDCELSYRLQICFVLPNILGFWTNDVTHFPKGTIITTFQICHFRVSIFVLETFKLEWQCSQGLELNPTCEKATYILIKRSYCDCVLFILHSCYFVRPVLVWE